MNNNSSSKEENIDNDINDSSLIEVNIPSRQVKTIKQVDKDKNNLPNENDEIEDRISNNLIKYLEIMEHEKIDDFVNAKIEQRMDKKLESINDMNNRFNDRLTQMTKDFAVFNRVIREELNDNSDYNTLKKDDNDISEFERRFPNLNGNIEDYKVVSKIREILDFQGKKLSWLQEQTKIPKSTFNSILNGTNSISLENAFRISAKIGFKIEDIWKYEINE